MKLRMSKTTIIDAKKRKLFPSLSELKRYKDLFITLAWRDFRVRYAQTTIGFLWAFIQPIVTLIILSIV
ncbi:MAG: phosphate ABC transporter permease, partial [Bacteroidetes bacterium]